MIINKNNLIIGSIVGLLLITTGFFGGWASHKTFKPCPVITSDTITIMDSTWYHIADSLINLPPREIIKWLPSDTIYMPGVETPIVVDTAAILKNYFSVYKYTWLQQDSAINLVLTTTVTQNKPIKYDLRYKWLQPTTVINNNIDNSITYNRYISVGVGVPIKNLDYSSVEATYTYRKGYVGTMYIPRLKSFGIRAGVNLIKFKQKK